MPVTFAPPRLLPLRALSDERLAALVEVGHDDAFAQLYERYRDPLTRYCRSIVRDPEDTLDALQATMLSALRAMQSKAPNGRIRPWLYKIAHNESINVLRRRRPDEELTEELTDRLSTRSAHTGDPSDSGVRERLSSLLSDLRALPERQRGAIVMRELAGLEYSEIGTALRMSGVAARKAVFEARVSLADLEAGREANCDEIMGLISDGDGRSARSRRVRSHLQSCPNCAAFELSLGDRRRTLALIPALPAVSGTALLTSLLGHGGAGAGVHTGPLGAGVGVHASSLSGSGASRAVAGGATALGGGGATILGGGGAAAVKCLALCSALAVAGAGVIVDGEVAHHAHRPAHVSHAVASAPVRHKAPTAPITHRHTAPAHHAPAAAGANTAVKSVAPRAAHKTQPVVPLRPPIWAHHSAKPVTTAVTAAPATTPAAPAPATTTSTAAAAPKAATTSRTNPLASLMTAIASRTAPSPTTLQQLAAAAVQSGTQTGTQAMQTWQQLLTSMQQQAAAAVPQSYQSLLSGTTSQPTSPLSDLQKLMSSVTGGKSF